MQTQTLNDYTYMVLSQNDQLNQDVGEVLDNVFGLRKVQNSMTDIESFNDGHVDIALIDKESYNSNELDNWNSKNDSHTKLILIVDELSRMKAVGSDKVFAFVSKSTLQNQLLTTVSRLIVDIELERLRLQQSELYHKEVFVKGESTFYRLVLEDVDYIEAYGNYIKIHYSNGKWSIGNCSISAIEEKLRNDKFCRIHRSYMVRLDRVDNFNSLNLEINKNILPIGRNYKKNFESHLIKL